MKISVYVAIGLESRASPSRYNRTNLLFGVTKRNLNVRDANYYIFKVI